MPYGMYLSAEGAKAQAQRLEFIANNLANVDTPGFKRDVPTFQARFSEAIQRGQDFPGSKSRNDVGGGVKLIGVETDFSHATLKSTGVKPTWLSTATGSSRSAARVAKLCSLVRVIFWLTSPAA